MAQVLRTISARTSRRGSTQRSAPYADLLDEFDPLVDDSKPPMRARHLRGPSHHGRSQSAVPFDHDGQRVVPRRIPVDSSPDHATKQTDSAWEDFYKSFGNETLAVSGTPPPQPAASSSMPSMDVEDDASDEESAYNEAEGQDTGFRHDPALKKPRKPLHHGRSRSHLPQAHAQKLQRQHEKVKNSQSLRSSRRNSSSRNKVGKKKSRRSRSRDVPDVHADKRTPFTTLHVTPFDTPDEAEGEGLSSAAHPAIARLRGGPRKSKSLHATPRNAGPIHVVTLDEESDDIISGFEGLHISAPKYDDSMNHPSFTGPSPIAEIPETGEGESSDSTTSDEPSSSIPPTPPVKNFIYKVEDLSAETTRGSPNGARRQSKRSSSSKRRHLSRTRTEVASPDSPTPRGLKKKSKSLRRSLTARSHDQRHHNRVRTMPSDLGQAAELRERYEKRREEREAQKLARSLQTPGQMSAHGLAHSQFAKKESINTLQREYGLDGRAKKVVKEVWAPQKVTMAQVNVWEGDWLMEAHFEFCNFTSQRVPVAVKFTDFSSNHQFLRDGMQPFYPNIGERNIVTLEPHQMNYKFFVVKRREQKGTPNKLELNYRFGFRRLGRWQMAW